MLPASVSQTEFSNEHLATRAAESGIALPSTNHSAGVAMLGALDNDPAAIARLAKMERVEAVVRYDSRGQKFEPENPFWT